MRIKAIEMDLVTSFFTFTRIIVVVSRPILLFYIVMRHGEDVAAVNMALLMTMSASMLMSFSVDAHREFYRCYFSKEFGQLVTTREYIRLINFFGGALLVTSIVFFLITFFTFSSVVIALIFTANVLLEKIYDEYQRFIIFEKLYLKWSVVAILFYFVPVFFCVAVNEAATVDLVLTYLVISFMVNTLVFAYIVKETGLGRFLRKISVLRWLKLARQSILYFTDRFKYLVCNFASGHNLLVMRYAVVFIDSQLLPSFVLFMQCGGVISSLVDMLYLAFRRERFVRIYSTALDSLQDRKLLRIMVVSVIFALSASLTINHIKFDDSELSLYFVFLVIGICGFHTISVVLFESIYWHKSISERIGIELIYYFLAAMVLWLVKLMSLNTAMLLSGFLMIVIVKVATQIRLLRVASPN